MRRRLSTGYPLAAVLLAAAACGGSSGGSASGAPSSSSPSATDSNGCHTGVVRTVDDALALLTDPAGCPGAVNTFWRQQLGDKWTDTVFVPYDDGQVPKSACTEGVTDPSETDDNAFYCDKDDKVYYSRNLLHRLFSQGGALAGPYQPTVVLMHELGHRADHLANHEGVVSRSEENQADCSAGAETRFAYDAKRLPLTDPVKAGALLFSFGDKGVTTEMASDPGAHGTPPERGLAFADGYLRGYSACLPIGRNPQGKVGGV